MVGSGVCIVSDGQEHYREISLWLTCIWRSHSSSLTLKTYEESIMEVTLEMFLNWANWPVETGSERNTVQHP